MSSRFGIETVLRTFHAIYDASSQETAESACEDRSTVEYSNTLRQLTGLVPTRQKQHDPRKEACFKQGKHYPKRKHASQAVDSLDSHRYGAPCGHDRWKEYTWSRPSQYHDSGRLEDQVSDEEDGKDQGIIGRGQLEVCLHASNFCVADVGSIEIVEDICESSQRCLETVEHAAQQLYTGGKSVVLWSTRHMLRRADSPFTWLLRENNSHMTISVGLYAWSASGLYTLDRTTGWQRCCRLTSV
jgi:hypothetical protein